jgi:hypothetical protein
MRSGWGNMASEKVAMTRRSLCGPVQSLPVQRQYLEAGVAVGLANRRAVRRQHFRL